MITFSALGKKGNLGNQLFQIASTIGIAQANGHDYFFPEWQYSQYLEHPLPSGQKNESFVVIKAKQFTYYKWELGDGNYDLNAWLQTEKYFDRNFTRRLFSIELHFKDEVLKRNAQLFRNKTILISVRRGDFVGHPNYFQLSYTYYLQALLQNFPDWEQRNLIFTSDDISYCKYHFGFLPNAHFLDGFSPFEQFAIAGQCDDYVISHSTFSWWAAWLGETAGKKVIRPIKNLAGQFAVENDDSDYFPERWIAFDDSKYKLPTKFLALQIRGAVYDLAVTAKIKYRKAKRQLKKSIRKILGKS